ncbi:MAG: LysR family transcriptional regulator [Spirochaetales bacterium]|nr:LysR family transcriptional regulator [Spirochaetales bacterium]
MDFSELETFIALAETQNFAKAAQQIHLSPSAVSRLICRLEDECEARLFERDTRQVRITRQGEDFLRFARDCIGKKKELSLNFQGNATRLRGPFAIYASVTACYSILPPLAEAITQEYPEAQLSVETGDPAGAAQAVREGRAELAVTAIPVNGFPDLLSFSVRKSPLVFVSAKTGPFGNIKALLDTRNTESSLLKTLRTTPLLLPRAGLSRQRFNAWVHRIQQHGEPFSPVIAAETGGNEALLALARLGLGLALIPHLVLDNSPFSEGLTIYQAGSHFGDYDIGFIQQPSKLPDSRKQAIADLITRVYNLV